MKIPIKSVVVSTIAIYVDNTSQFGIDNFHCTFSIEKLSTSTAPHHVQLLPSGKLFTELDYSLRCIVVQLVSLGDLGQVAQAALLHVCLLRKLA